GPPAGRPGEHPLAEGGTAGPAGPRFALREADPGNFRVGVRNRRDHPRIEATVQAGRYFRRDSTLVGGLVSQHGLPDDVANGEDGGNVRSHLPIGGDETALISGDPGVLRPDQAPIWRTANRYQ